VRVSIIIPTTDGPAQVLRLAPLQSAPRSVMRTQQDYRPLPVSAAYQAFTAQGGPLDVAFGMSSLSFDLRLSARVDTGRSWELPVALAHWFQAEGHLVGVDEPELLVWATGALDLDMGVILQDYHLERKLAASLGLLKAAVEKGCRVLVLLPDAAMLPEELESTVALHQVTSVQEAIDIIRPLVEDGARRPSTPSVIQAPKGLSVMRAAVLGSIGIAGLTTLAVFAGFALREAPIPTLPMSDQPIAQAEASRATSDMNEVAVRTQENENEQDATRRSNETAETETAAIASPGLVLLRAKEGESCIDVHFGGANPVRELHTHQREGFSNVSLNRLCAMGLRMPDNATGTWIVKVPEALRSHVTRSERLTEFRLEPGKEHLFRLTADLPADLQLRWQITNSSGETIEVHHMLSALQ
jgi:hypothetical protein